MRFQTSQATPPHLNRRLQLRMLSFVGLFAVVMFTLTAMNLRTRNPDSARENAVSPDSLTFEVRREQRELKDGEFVIPGDDDDGIRGQSPRTDLDQDRGLFTSRDKERGQSSRDGDKLFSRRNGSPRRESPEDLDDSPSSHRVSGRRGVTNAPAFDDDETVVKARPGADRHVPSGSPLIEDDWSSDPVAIDGASPSRRNTSTGKSAPRRDSFDIDRPLTNRNPAGERFQPSSREIDVAGFQDDLEVRSPNARGLSSRDDYIPESGRSSSSRFEDTQDQPIDLRRHRNPTQYSNSDSPPPYSEAAKARIDRRYLEIVKDNTIGIRREESEVFFWLLDHARRIPSSALERSSDHEAQYINVMTEPDRFRGELITIEGDLWRLYEFDASKNDYGVEKMYEGWVFTGDSGNHPYRIVCTSIPNDFELGENLRKPVRVTGYFFKREGYRSNGGVHVAPTLIAKKISINPMPNGIPQTAGILPYMIGAIMAVGMALLVTIVGFAIGDSRSSRQGMERMRRQPSVSFAGLTVPPADNVEETLRQLSELDKPAPVNGAYGPLFSREANRSGLAGRESQGSMDTQPISPRVQANTLQSWSTRQQALQAEIDGLRATNRTKSGNRSADDLDTDHLDVATNVLQKGKSPELPTVKTIAKPATPVSSSPVTPAASAVSVPAATPSRPVTPVAVPSPPSSAPSYAASKIAEWETEISQLTGASTETTKPISTTPPAASAPVTTVAAPSARSDSEQKTRESLIPSSAISDLKSIQATKAADQNIDEDEDLEDEERVSFDRADRDSKSFTLPGTTASTDDSIDDDVSLDDDVSSDSPKPSRWERFRRRRNR